MALARGDARISLIPVNVFQRGKSEEPGPGTGVVMKEWNRLWNIMMSDGWFRASKWMPLQKCIPNSVASNWINRYKWAAAVYSAQGARHWYSAQVGGVSTRLPADFKISFSIKGTLHTRGTDDQAGNADCCLPAVSRLSLCLSFQSLSSISAKTPLILHTFNLLLTLMKQTSLHPIFSCQVLSDTGKTLNERREPRRCGREKMSVFLLNSNLLTWERLGYAFFI